MFRFETTFDHQAADVLKDHTQKKLWTTLVACSIMGCVIGVPVLFIHRMFGALLLVMSILLPLFFRYALRASQKKLNESYSLLSPLTHEVYTFEEEGVTVETTKGEEYSSVVKARWSYFWRIEETETHYLCYISAEQAHVVPKADIAQGTTEDFNMLLTRMLGQKFVPFKPKPGSSKHKK